MNFSLEPFLLCYTPLVWNRIKLAVVLLRGRLKDLLQLSCSLYNRNIKQIAVLKSPLSPSLSFSNFIRCSYYVSHWQSAVIQRLPQTMVVVLPYHLHPGHLPARLTFVPHMVFLHYNL